MFRKAYPNSIKNPSNERYEHFLVWLSPGGGTRQWLFSHTDGEEVEDFDSFTIETQNNIRSVPVQDRIEVEAVTMSLDAETFDYVRSIMKSNRVYKVNKDASKTPIAITQGSIAQANTLKEFQVKIKFVYKEEFRLDV